MHPQQILISRDDHVSPAIQRDLQKLVIFRVAAFTDGANDGDKFCGVSDQTNELQPRFDGDITIELGLRKVSRTAEGAVPT